MKSRPLFHTAGVALALALALGCSAPPRRSGNLPPPVRSYTLGPGDKFEMVIVGEEKLPKEYTVAPDGTVEFPYIQRVELNGLEPQELAHLVAQQLEEKGFLRKPSVVINIKEFGSKRVIVGGQVNKPGDVPYTPGLSLYRVITNAGGFTATANRGNVLVTRKLRGGGTKTVSFSVNDISEGRSPDIPLQDGDSVYVDERLF